jgi:hypothetical protein
MQHGARRAAAYVVARAASGQNASAINDYETGSYHNFSGQVGDRVNVYDYTRGNYLTGPLNSLYDYAQGNYLQIKPRGGGRFSGYDYASSQYFEARVRGRSVNLYDYETGSYYDFQI